MRVGQFLREYCNPLHAFLLADNCRFCLLRRLLKSLKKPKPPAPPEDNRHMDEFLSRLQK